MFVAFTNSFIIYHIDPGSHLLLAPLYYIELDHELDHELGDCPVNSE